MDESHVVFDISSDEEAAFDEPEGDDFNWLSKLLCDEVDNSDEVVVVREIKSKSSKPAVNNEDDDDCVVLDGDPDKSASVDNDQTSEGDDLVIVGQKGQVACRDYPHPRHLCAKFPFGSTAHDIHCDLCHCYVCDLVSPCAHWGTGASNIDHCHATDKDEFWKSQRKNFRLQKDAPLPIKVPDNPLSTSFTQLNQIPPHDIIQLASNSIPQNQLSRPAVIRACSSSNRLSTPSIIRSRQPRPAYSKNRPQTHTASQQSPLHRVRNNAISRGRTLNASNLGMFRRAVIAGGALAMNQSMYGSANNTGGAQASQCANNPAPRATSNDETNIHWVPSMNQDSCTYQSFPQTATGSIFVNTVPSQSQVYSHEVPQSQVYSQSMPQPPVYSQPIPQAPVYSQPISELEVCSQPMSQSHIYTKHKSQSSNVQNINELGSQKQDTTGPEFSDPDMWLNVSGSNQQPPVENYQLHKTGSKNELLSVQEFNSHCNGNGKLHYNDLEYDTGFPENNSVEVAEGYMPATFDAGMLLFDFETSFNGLAHV